MNNLFRFVNLPIIFEFIITSIFVASTFFLFYFSSIIVLGTEIGKETKEKRDIYMANKIIKETKKNNYEYILVICGKRHKERIVKKLKKRKPDWNITPK